MDGSLCQTTLLLVVATGTSSYLFLSTLPCFIHLDRVTAYQSSQKTGRITESQTQELGCTSSSVTT